MPAKARMLALVMVAAVVACSRGEPPASIAARPVLRPVALPDVSNASEAVQAQIRERYASLQTAIARVDTPPVDLAAAYGEMGKLLTAAEYFDPAEICFDDARMLAPGDMRWPYFLGHVLRFKNDPDGAAKAFEAAGLLAPDDVPTLVWLAEMYLARSRPDEADGPLTRALGLDSRNAAVRFGLGRVALAKHDYARAVEHLEAAVTAAPEATRIHYPLALAYRGLGNRSQAEAHLRLRGERDVAAIDPLLDQLTGVLQHAAYEARGASALDEGRWADAAASLRKAVKLDPNNAFTQLNLGTALYMLGDADEALEHYRSAVRLSPRQARAHFGIGVIMEARGDDGAAIDAFTSAVQFDPGHVEARFSLANALRRRGRVQESLAQYEEVLRANPAVSQASFGYAMGLVRLGRYQEARDRLERDAKTFSDQAGFPHALARLLAAAPDDRVRDGARAAALVRTLLEAQRSPALAETMAMALAEQGRFDEAVRWQRDAIDLARKSGRAGVPRELEANLRLYERRQPCRVPWADDDPVHHPVPAR